MAANIEEIFWMLESETKKIVYVNEAYRTITGYSPEELLADNTSCKGLIHPHDHDWVVNEVAKATSTGRIDARFRIVRADSEIRWVAVHGYPVRNSKRTITHLVGIARDVTAQKQAEEEASRSLSLAQSASTEAEALSRATLALVQDLRIDYVLDTLLQCLTDLIPFESACVLLLDSDTHLFIAREKRSPSSARDGSIQPSMLDLGSVPIVKRLISTGEGVLIDDTAAESEWREMPYDENTKSWIGVPLVASAAVVGVLAMGSTHRSAFTTQHMRRGKLLAVPAAAAIHNARLFERAEIFASELELRLADLHHAREELIKLRGNRWTS
jgi:PAS domain S-box-containing protein